MAKLLSGDTHNTHAVNLPEQGSTPATPATGRWKDYFTSSGKFYLDDAGAIYSVFNDRYHLYPVSDGVYYVGSGAFRMAGFYGFFANLSYDDAATNTVTNVLTLSHRSSGTPAAGFGTGIQLWGETTTTTDVDIARIRAIWNTATHASRKGSLILSVFDTAERDALTITTDGSTPTSTFTGNVVVTDSTFQIKDNADSTKIAVFQASGITTATTRTFTFPDADITLAGQAQLDLKSPAWIATDFPFTTGIQNAHVQSLSASANARSQIQIPTNAQAIDSLQLLFYVTGAGSNPTFNISTHYGASGEAYNNHTGSGSGVTFSAGASNVLTYLDISSYASSLAAGDFLSVLFTRVTDGGWTWYIIGLMARGH